MGKLRAGVIGLGVGLRHLLSYKENPNVEVVAICDPFEERLRKISSEHGIEKAFADYRQIIDMKDVDLVSVASPDHFHTEQCIAALESGKHVLCEKPLAPSVEKCRRIMSAVDRTGKKFMIGQVCRFTPAFKLAKKMIDRGDIGELFFVESEYAHNYLHAKGVNEWRKDPSIRREPFLGGACHAVDLVRWVAGDAEEVFGYANHMCLTDWPTDDCTIASIKFKSGTIGKVFGSIGCVRPYTMRSVFYGTKGTIVCDNTSTHIQLYRSDMSELPDFMTIPIRVDNHSITSEVDELVDCILQNKPVTTDALEGTKTVATCLAVIESTQTGQPVKLDYSY